MCQLHQFLEFADMATVTNALIKSRLDYCNALYTGLPLESVWKLQRVKNASARLLTGAGYREHVTPLLQQVHWLLGTIQSAAFTYKALNGLGPSYLKDGISLYEPAWALR